MAKSKYTKSPTTYTQQVELLRSRGMIIKDDEAAKLRLQHLNYYRIGAYWLPFEEDHTTHKFQDGTTFEQVIELYEFDRELRLLVLDAIERVEVSVRSNWAYRLGHLHGPHAHDDSSIAFKPHRWRQHRKELVYRVEDSDEVFITHFKNTYSDALPPIWSICEVISFGLLSRLYSNIKPMNTRRLIAGVYKLDEGVFASWLHHLSVVRNVCAHHSRLWNRDFAIAPMIPKSKPSELVGQIKSNGKLHNTLVILLYLIDVISETNEWRTKLINLFQKYSNIDYASMGFPDEWEQLDIWKL